jgi:CRISPR/Cas system-associated exonuclease Cas4 (RecB family)
VQEWWDNPRTEVPAVEDVSNQVPGEVKGWKYYPPPIPPGTYTLVNLDKNEKV